MFQRACQLFFFVLLFSHTRANVVYINDSSFGVTDWCTAAGNDITGNGSAALPYATLTKALTVAVSGDTIRVDAGLYANQSGISITTPGIIITGYGISSTIFELNAGTANFLSVSVGNCLFMNFTVRGYNSSTALQGKAITITDAIDVNLYNILFENCSSLVGGEAAVYIATTAGSNVIASVQKCAFINNNGNFGGAIDIVSNTANGAVTNTVLIDSCYFENNAKLLGLGGALYIYNGPSSGGSTKAPIVNLKNSLFGNNCTGNSALRGGAVCIDNLAQLTVNNCCFSNNQAIDGTGPEGGGAFWVGSSVTTINDSKFENNSANIGVGKQGGAICLNAVGTSGSFKIDRCAFINNQANQGGAVFVGKTNITLLNSLFYGNTTTGASAMGGGMGINSVFANITMYNCTFSKNTTATANRGDGIDNSGGFFNSFTFKNCIVYGNGVNKEIYCPGVNVNWSTIGPLSTPGPDYNNMTGNTNADPLFTNSSGNDFTLSGTTSPAYNTGNSDGGAAPIIDINSLPRPQFDMGCYALNSTPVLKYSCTNHVNLANITPGAIGTCPGQTVALSASPSTGYTYTWSSIPAGFSASTASVVVTPTAATVYQVQLDNIVPGCGSYGTTTYTVTMGDGPVPVIKPDYDSICSGDIISVTASGAVSYTWTVSSGTINPVTGTVISYTAPTTAVSTTSTFSVVGTDSLGCVSTRPGVKTITINPIPTITATPVNASLCSGDTTSFFSTGADTYTWTVSGGTLDTLQGSPVVYTAPSVTAATVYTVTSTGTAYLRCTSAPVSFTVMVNPLPILSVTPADSVVCSVSTITITAAGANTYTWSGGAGTLSSGNANPVVYTVPSVTATTGDTLNLSATSAAGCLSSLNAAVTLTVNPVPSVSQTASVDTLCAGTTTTLTAVGANSYTWNSGAGSFNTSTSNPTVFTAPNATVATTVAITLIGTNSFGCANPVPDTLLLTIDAAPAISNTITASNICNGATTTISVSGANTYTWTNSGGSLNTTSGDTVVFTAPTVTTATNYTVSVNGTALNGCVTPVPTDVVVTVNPNPVIIPTYTLNNLCEGLNTAFSASGASTYTWTASSGTLSSANGSPVTFTPQVTGSAATITLTVDGISGAGCLSTGVASFTISIDPAPVPSAASSTTSICSGGTTTLTATGASTYTWNASSGVMNTNNSTPSIYTAPGVTVATTATITLNGTSSAGCANLVADTVFISIDAMPVLTTGGINSSICSGDTATLTVGGATTYTWSTSLGNLSPTTGSTTSYTAGSVSAPTAATITVNGSSAAGCPAAPTVLSFTVNPLPVPNILSTNTVICSGTATSFTAFGANTYTWSAGSGAFSSTTGTPVTYTAPVISATNTITISVNAASGAGCLSASPTTVAVIVNAEPPTSIATPPSQVCSGNSTSIVASGAPSYSWTATSGTVTPSTGNLVTFQSPTVSAVTIVTVAVTGDNGTCSNSSPVITTVTVNPITVPVISLSGSPALCQGDTVILTSNPTTGILWNTGATTPSITVTTSGSFTVIATNSFGCSAASSVVTTTLFPVSSAPVITANGPVNFCQGDSLLLTLNQSNGVWQPGGLTGDSIYVSTSATYTVTYMDGNNCPSQASAIGVTVYSLPIFDYTNLVVLAEHCDKNDGGIFGINVSGNNPFTYTWYDSTGTVISTGSTSLNNIPGGTYSLQVSDVNGCVVTGNNQVVPDLPGIQVVLSATPTTGTAPLTVDFTATTSINNVSGGYTWNYGMPGTYTTSTNLSQYIYAESGWFTTMVMVTDSFGCSDTAWVSVFVLASENIVIPNVFTPNGDGINDGYSILVSGISKLEIGIYDRWGKLVYEQSGGSIYWDGNTKNGREASAGTYYYVLNYTTDAGQQKEAKGYITLVR